MWQILNVNRFYSFISTTFRALFTFCKCRHEKATSIFLSFLSIFFYLDTEYNVYQSDVTRSSKKCWELVKLVSASCKLIYARHVPDSSPKFSSVASVNSGGQEASLERDYGRTVVERSRLKGGRTIYTIYSETLLTSMIKKIRDQLRQSHSSSVAHAIWSLSQLHFAIWTESFVREWMRHEKRTGDLKDL